MEIIIGKQVWSLENLNVSTFRNGETILEARTSEEWINADENKIPAWCYLDNNEENGVKFGKLYNYYAIIDERGLVPDGFTIPGKKDWLNLFKFIGGNEIACKILKSEKYWDTPGDNSVGFSALPSGFRFYHGDFGTSFDKSCNFWSADSKEDTHAIGFNIGNNREDIDIRDVMTRFRKGTGRAIRLIKKK